MGIFGYIKEINNNTKIIKKKKKSKFPQQAAPPFHYLKTGQANI